MPLTCTASALEVSARDFFKCSDEEQEIIKTYLLCQYANSSSAPTLTGFLFSINNQATTVTSQWDVVPVGVTKTEIWTSSDNITFALEVTVAAPTTGSTAVVPPTVGNTKYAKARWCVGASCGNFCAVQSVTHDLVNDWVANVVINGGAEPSGGTITAARTFYNTLVADASGVWAQLIMINIIAPDSDAALRTPLLPEGGHTFFSIIHAGGGGGTAYVLDINGFASNGAADSQFLNTSFVPSTYFSKSDGGYSIYQNCTGPNNNGHGASDGAGYEPVLQMVPAQASANQVSAYAWSNATVLTQPNRLTLNAFFSLNRTANNSLNFYYANSTHAWNLYGSSAGVEALNPPANPIGIGALNNSVGGYVIVNNHVSFIAAHHGLTSAQGQALFNAAQALRVALGGGFA